MGCVEAKVDGAFTGALYACDEGEEPGAGARAQSLLFDHVIADDQVRARAHANTFENFALAAKEKIEGLMIDRMDRNAAIVTKFLDEDDFKRFLSEYLARRIYEDLRKTG